MNNNKITRYCIILFGYLAVLYPLYVVIASVRWGFNADLIEELFPLFGIMAFTLLWLHSISGVFEPWLRKHINFDRFVQITATLIFWCIILHPLLLLFTLRFNINNLFIIYGTTYIWFGIVGWLLLLTYDITKPLKKYHFFSKNWNNILIISNIGFLITFFHSLYIGADLQTGPLRIVWIFYGVTGIAAIAWTYGIKRMLKK